MKKIFSIILATVMLFAVVPIGTLSGLNFFSLTASAVEVDYSYEIRNGTAIIHGYYGSIVGEIVIPSELRDCPVVRIDERAFADCQNITSVTIPDSVKSIGYEAFSQCINLKSVTLSEKLTTIEDKAFSECTSLKDITLPDGVTSIGNSAFYNCTSLTDITIPDSVTDLGVAVFYGCSSLTNVAMSKNAKSIGKDLFKECGCLKNINLPDNITSIGDFAFKNCASLTDVIIPEGVTSIGDDAFACCTNLTSVKMPNTLKKIGNGVFFSCTSLTDAVIPSGVTSIGEEAFYNCKSLTDVTIPNGIKSIGYATFSQCRSLKNVIIPNSVTSIGDSAFYCCTSLTDIKIPETVKSIAQIAFEQTGYYNNSSNWQNEVLYIGNFLIRAKREKGGSYTIKSGTKYIACSAFFDCKNLTGISIPDSVTNIDIGVFCGCTSLTSVTIGKGVTNIGNSAFVVCTKIKNVYYTGTQAQWKRIKIGTNNENLTNVKIQYSSRTVVFNANGGKVLPTFAKVPADTRVGLPTATRSGCTFLGWSANKLATSATYRAGQSVKITNNTTLYAIWSVNAPKNVKAVSASSTNIKVVFDKVSGASGYQVYNQTLKKVYNTATNSYVLTKLKPGTTYTIFARAYIKNGDNVIYSPWAKGVIIKNVPTAVTGVKINQVNSTSVKINWTKKAYVSGYQVYNKTTGKAYATTATTFTFKGITKDKTSTYFVRAYYLNGSTKVYGAWSKGLNFKTK